MVKRPGRYEQILKQAKRIASMARDSTAIIFAFRLLKANAQERANAWMLEHFGRIYPHGMLTEFGNWGGAMDTTQPLPFEGKWASESVGGHGEGACAYPAMNIKVAVNGDVKFCSCVDYDNLPENIIGSARRHR